YFDASRHRAMNQNGIANYDQPFGVADNTPLFALKRPNESNPARREFVNYNKFQILHAGLDDTWGDFRMFGLNAPNTILFPEGPFAADTADALTNITTGTRESAQE